MLGKEITIGGYLPGDSILHRLDARTKLLCFLTLLLVVLFSSRPHTLIAPILLSAVAMVASGLGWRVWINGLSRFRLMLLVTLSLNLFMDTDGAPIQFMGYVTPFSYEGLERSLFFCRQNSVGCHHLIGVDIHDTSLGPGSWVGILYQATELVWNFHEGNFHGVVSSSEVCSTSAGRMETVDRSPGIERYRLQIRRCFRPFPQIIVCFYSCDNDGF